MTSFGTSNQHHRFVPGAMATTQAHLDALSPQVVAHAGSSPWMKTAWWSQGWAGLDMTPTVAALRGRTGLSAWQTMVTDLCVGWSHVKKQLFHPYFIHWSQWDWSWDPHPVLDIFIIAICTFGVLDLQSGYGPSWNSAKHRGSISQERLLSAVAGGMPPETGGYIGVGVHWCVELGSAVEINGLHIYSPAMPGPKTGFPQVPALFEARRCPQG